MLKWHWKQNRNVSTCKPRRNKTQPTVLYLFILQIILFFFFLHAFNNIYSLCNSLMCIFNYKQCRNDAIKQWTFTDHLIVLFRLGWLTVLSSMNIVEQELYFFESRPGETFGEDQHLIHLQTFQPYKQAQPQNKVHNTFTHVVYVIAFPPIPYWKRENQGFLLNI